MSDFRVELDEDALTGADRRCVDHCLFEPGRHEREARCASWVVQHLLVLLHVRDAVFEDLEHFRAVVFAQAIPGAEVLIDPHAHVRRIGPWPALTVERGTVQGVGDDLFSEAARSEAAASAPLAARMRPKVLDEVVGQEHLTGPGRPIRRLIQTDRGFSVLLWGPPGCGKTTIAEVMALESSRRFERLSAVSAGVKDLRAVLERAASLLGEQGVRTVLFVDEIHRFSVVQQDALLHAVEAGEVSLVGATTENPVFSVTSALRSRSMLLQLRAVSAEAIEGVLQLAALREGVAVTPEAVRMLARRATGDVRVALGALEMAISLAGGEVREEHAAEALGVAVTRLGKDDHYDLASVLIKSMRAGDVDAALHWLARLIQSGEDPRFVSRRLMIFASEDVGVADDGVLGVCADAHAVVQAVGMPEGRYALAHAVVRCALASKSRRVTDALDRATADVTEGRSGRVPEITPETRSFRPVGFADFSYWGEPLNASEA